MQQVGLSPLDNIMMDTEENNQNNFNRRYLGHAKDNSNMKFDEDPEDRLNSNRLHENDDEYDVPDEESNI